VTTLARLARSSISRWETLLVVLILGGGVWSWTLSSFFLRRANLLDLATPYIFIGLLAFGLTFVVVAGEIDISVASTMAVAAVAAAQVWHAGASIWVGAIAALGVAHGVQQHVGDFRHRRDHDCHGTPGGLLRR